MLCIYMKGVQMLGGRVTDVHEATAMSVGLEKVDIFSASWGPSDDGQQVEGPGHLAKRALKEGVNKVFFHNNCYYDYIYINF